MNSTENAENIPSGDVATTLVVSPSPPPGVSAGEAEELSRRASEVVAELRDASGSRELTMVDQIASVGMQTQQKAGGDLDLLRTRMGGLVGGDGEGASGRIAKDLTELRVTLSQIDPNKVRQESLVRRLAYMLPVGKNQMLRTLETIAVRYEPVSKQVVVLESRLRDGRMLLRRDNVELTKLYEQVEAQQLAVQKNRYLGELLLERLEGLLAETEDPHKRDRIQNAIFDVSMRVQDLHTMDEVHSQLFVGIEMTRQNNSRLGQAVERSLTLVGSVVMVGLAVQSALVRQWRVLEATKRTREFLGNVLVANAGAIKSHTAEIGDVYTSPVIAMEKIARAHADLLAAIDIAANLRDEGIAVARQNVVELQRLSEELRVRAGSTVLTAPGPALEA
jgi:uncharacterized protein YaaN involved in tellurite resistance